MKRKSYSQEQIIRILKEHEAGVPANEIIRKHGIANGTFYRWKSKYGGMDVCEAKRLSGTGSGECQAQKAAGRNDARENSGGGCVAPKVVKPMARRGVVGFLQQQYRLSQRAACRLADNSRQAMAYRSKPSGDQVLLEERVA